MGRYFNTAGPCYPDEHYMLPALDRLPDVRQLVERRQYFVIHAPRQTGKTTSVQALADEINDRGDRFALYCSLETLQNVTDPESANAAIRDLILDNAYSSPSFPHGFAVHEPSADYGGNWIAIRTALRTVCREAGKPVVVFFDEADCLVDRVLISFLRQLRDGYVNRKKVLFPDSIALIGMLDVRDYKAQIRTDGESLGQISPFNIISKDLMIRNFTEDEVRALYSQHTEETGRKFENDAIAKVMDLTGGQPWLVNAIARECVEEIHRGNPLAPVTAADVDAAKENIIRRRDTHVDSLMERLREPRVRRIVDPVIFGGEQPVSRNDEDWRFVMDLGLLKENEDRELVPANRMYAEIIGRYLTRDVQDNMVKSVPQTPWATPDGLDLPGLMAAFQAFWRENAGADRFVYDYKEATPHLVLMAFLQRVTNGEGRIIREMALGSGRLDLCVEFRGKRHAIEVKTSKNFVDDKSYAQLAAYLDTLGLSEGWMAVFDLDPSKPWSDKLYNRDVEFAGKTIHVVGL